MKKLLVPLVLSSLSIQAFASPPRTTVYETQPEDRGSQTIAISGADKDTRIAKVSVPLLTLCTPEQVVQAVQWQKECRDYAEYNALYSIYKTCTLLSYQRFCDFATPDQVIGKRTVRPLYINTYRR